jgi:hypothetical protein
MFRHHPGFHAVTERIKADRVLFGMVTLIHNRRLLHIEAGPIQLPGRVFRLLMGTIGGDKATALFHHSILTGPKPG